MNAAENQVIYERKNVLTRKKRILKSFTQNVDLYLLSIPGIIFLIVFRYTPMYGAIIAFKDYNVQLGILGSKWVGFMHFQELFSSRKFFQLFTNTLLISVYKLVFQFPAPIILALLMNEIRNTYFKRSIQTITYLPHFVSWVVISGVFLDLLSPSAGIVNRIIEACGGEAIFFMADKRFFRGILVVSQMWKEAGWGAIIYLAAISGIDQELYEASRVDGAGRLRQTWHITLPGMRSTIAVMLIIRIGSIMEAGQDQILMMYNTMVYDVADIIDTYVFRVGLGAQMQFSFSAAAGLFKSVIGCTLLMITNFLSKKLQDESIW